MAEIKLEEWTDGGWSAWTVTFPSAAVAIMIIKRKMAENEARDSLSDYHSFRELEDSPVACFGPLTTDELALLDILYPSCPHGLSAELCMDWDGDNHFGTREQELAGIL
jgi:hypothetical protein